MIDTASFLNSKDIADYWYKIGWNSYCTPRRKNVLPMSMPTRI